MSRPWLSRPSQYWFPLGYRWTHEGGEGARYSPAPLSEATPVTAGPPNPTHTAGVIATGGIVHDNGLPAIGAPNVCFHDRPPSPWRKAYRTPRSSAGSPGVPPSWFSTVMMRLSLL